ENCTAPQPRHARHVRHAREVAGVRPRHAAKHITRPAGEVSPRHASEVGRHAGHSTRDAGDAAGSADHPTTDASEVAALHAGEVPAWHATEAARIAGEVAPWHPGETAPGRSGCARWCEALPLCIVQGEGNDQTRPRDEEAPARVSANG